MKILKKIKRLAVEITGLGIKRIKYNLTGIDIKEMEPTRKYTRKLLSDRVLQLKNVKGTTRHKKMKVDKKTDKRMWIERVRKLRKLLKNCRTEYKLNTKIYRKIYIDIKSNKITTKAKLVNAIPIEYKIK
jgi:ribosomal protein L19E